MSNLPRRPKKERRDQLSEIIVENSELMRPARKKVQQPAERVWNRLGLVVIVEASQIAPARIAAKFDQSRSQHDPENQPAKQPEDRDRRWPLRKRSGIPERT